MSASEVVLETPAPAPLIRMPTIWQAIPQITGAVAPIAKARKNEQQGYKFRGVDDVYAVLNLLLSRAGVSIVPEVLESWHEPFQNKSGGTMFRHRARVKYTLYASDASCISCVVEGEGMDSGDKSTQKALSMAYKYMAFQVFCIPTGEKIDTEEDSPEVNGHAPPPASADQAAEHLRLKQLLINAKTMISRNAATAAIRESHSKGLIADIHRKELVEVFAKLPAIEATA